jgi:transposase
MIAYSIDIRQRVVRAVKDKGMSKSQVAKLYDISRASVYRYLVLEEADNLAPQKHPGPGRRLAEVDCQKLLKQVEKYPDLSLEEQAEKLAKDHKLNLKKSSIANYFERLDVHRKKNTSSPRTG